MIALKERINLADGGNDWGVKNIRWQGKEYKENQIVGISMAIETEKAGASDCPGLGYSLRTQGLPWACKV
jgi:hypothetical protein